MKGRGGRRPDEIEAQDLSAERLASTGVIRSLGSAHDPTRMGALRRLRAFLGGRGEMSAQDMAKLWRGIFYAFWHADGVAYQAQLADELSGIVEGLQAKVAPLYVAGLFSTMRREWIGIDYLRLDKFLMLVRKFLSSTFRRIHASGWCSSHCRCLMDTLENEIFIPKSGPSAAGLAYHVADLYVEELCQAVDDPRHKPPCWSGIKLLLQPFINCILKSSNEVLVERVRTTVFYELGQCCDRRAFANMKPLHMKQLFLEAALEAVTDCGRTAAVEVAEEVGEFSVGAADGDLLHDNCVEAGVKRAGAMENAALCDEGGSPALVGGGDGPGVSQTVHTAAAKKSPKERHKKRKNDPGAVEPVPSPDGVLGQQLTAKKRKKTKKRILAGALLAVEDSGCAKAQAQTNGTSDGLYEVLGPQASNEGGFQKSERKRKRKKAGGGANETSNGDSNPANFQSTCAIARKQAKFGQRKDGTCSGSGKLNVPGKALNDVTTAQAWSEDSPSDDGGLEGNGEKAGQPRSTKSGDKDQHKEEPRQRGRKKKAKGGNEQQMTIQEQAMMWLSQMGLTLAGHDPQAQERVEKANEQWAEFYSKSGGKNANGTSHLPRKGKLHRVRFALGKNVVAGMDKPLPPRTLTNPPETSPRGPILRRC